ncbi:MAG: RnfABCDGE type electron transport complex subunit D, partial [Gemmatimonadetes bacterium]|nr:RnfABCDGE type electron transport complex subunit D [Gemmatimonadota bacterium]
MPRNTPRVSPAAAPARTPREISLPWTLALTGAFVVPLALLGLLFHRNEALSRSLLGAAGVLALWAAVLSLTRARTARRLGITFAAQRNHWVQMLAQGTVLLWWGWHVEGVYAYFPLLLAQILFAFGFDALLQWSRRGTWRMTFGPIPVMFSINLFLWFKPDWFHYQFAMIALGFLAKEFLRWTRDGRVTHIFNPSSFPLAVAALFLVVTGSSDMTLGRFIANTQHDPPFIYLVIFLVALPGQILFGVARMTLAAVLTAYGTSLAYFAATGTYLFFDTHIPVPVFLGMHLLFTDPATSPRTELGRIIFGVLYALGAVALYVLFLRVGVPTYWDKLLPVPLLNLMVRGIDGLASSKALAGLDPSRIARTLTPPQRNVAYTGLWAGLFVVMSFTQGVGDTHPGQYLPFWVERCEAGNQRACSYREHLTLVYCNNGSGWACNEWGILQVEQRKSPGRSFHQACDLGYGPACGNTVRDYADATVLNRGEPGEKDLPIVLRGT